MKREHLALTAPHASIGYVLFVFLLLFDLPIHRCQEKANWFHSRKDYMTWLWAILMSLALCECLKAKQASFSTIACSLFLIHNPRAILITFSKAAETGIKMLG
jgi:hypothetical protein